MDHELVLDYESDCKLRHVSQITVYQYGQAVHTPVSQVPLETKSESIGLNEGDTVPTMEWCQLH